MDNLLRTTLDRKNFLKELNIDISQLCKENNIPVLSDEHNKKIIDITKRIENLVKETKH